MTPSTRYNAPLTAETAEWVFQHLANGGDPKALGWLFGFDYFKQYRLVENFKKTKRLDKTADLSSFLRLLGLY